jgi:hypothetical protein
VVGGTVVPVGDAGGADPEGAGVPEGAPDMEAMKYAVAVAVWSGEFLKTDVRKKGGTYRTLVLGGPWRQSNQQPCNSP